MTQFCELEHVGTEFEQLHAAAMRTSKQRNDLMDKQRRPQAFKRPAALAAWRSILRGWRATAEQDQGEGQRAHGRPSLHPARAAEVDKAGGRSDVATLGRQVGRERNMRLARASEPLFVGQARRQPHGVAFHGGRPGGMHGRRWRTGARRRGGACSAAQRRTRSGEDSASLFAQPAVPTVDEGTCSPGRRSSFG
jgi:hypothetical protein